ncbi:MAG: nuclear transport factor 2 family protein [Pseudomonadota bacterium]
MRFLKVGVLTAVVLGIGIAIGFAARASEIPAVQDQSQLEPEAMQDANTLAVAKAFMGAAGAGDRGTLETLMAADFVWHNEGDGALPWIGTWRGKEVVLNEFLPAFGAGLATTSWSTDYAMSDGQYAIFMGTMAATATASGQPTGEFTWAVRVHVVDDLVQSWTWLEDSFAVSQAFHGRADD